MRKEDKQEQEAQEGLYTLYWFKLQLAEDFFKVFPIYRYVKHLTPPPPLGKANFNPRAMIWTNFVEVH